jgi:hypothetical protein
MHSSIHLSIHPCTLMVSKNQSPSPNLPLWPSRILQQDVLLIKLMCSHCLPFTTPIHFFMFNFSVYPSTMYPLVQARTLRNPWFLPPFLHPPPQWRLDSHTSLGLHSPSASLVQLQAPVIS